MAHVVVGPGIGQQPPQQRGRVLPDSQRAGDARVALKLSAIAYADARFGSDAGDVATVAAGWLGYQALRYCEALSDAAPGSLSLGEPSEAGVASLLRLRAVALAYAGARRGADGCAELCRDALAMLCSAAVDLGSQASQAAPGDRDPVHADARSRRLP